MQGGLGAGTLEHHAKFKPSNRKETLRGRVSLFVAHKAKGRWAKEVPLGPTLRKSGRD